MTVSRPLLAGILAWLLATPAAAHSLLLESSPAAGARLQTPPDRIALRFNNRIEKRLSRIRLVDEAGGPAPAALAVHDGAADRLEVMVPPLAPGAWRVEWQVLSTDGHVVSGTFVFRVAP